MALQFILMIIDFICAKVCWSFAREDFNNGDRLKGWISLFISALNMACAVNLAYILFV